MAKIEQKQELQHKINLKQILEASLFQLNSFSLEQRIYQELEKNPLLELSDPENNELEESEVDASDEESDDFEIDELYSNTDDFELYRSQNDKGNILDNRSANTNQLDSLKEQVEDLNLDQINKKIAYDIVDNLDQKGYLAIEPILIADRFNIELDQVLQIQKKIRLLDPPGISSCDIRECLLSQLEFHDYSNSDAYHIVQDYFKDFSKANYDHISEKLKISKEKIRDALDIISNLYLYPSDNSDQAVKETILPDLLMEKRDENWVISVNDSAIPELILNEKYTNMINDKKLPAKTKSFIKKNYNGAQFFLEAINHRKKTMISVMERISLRQLGYFNSDQKILKPMILKDIAEDLNIDISTVSRICNGKYVQLPWGILELRTFFNEGVTLANGDTVSSTVLKDDMVKVINNEPSGSPLKDEDIAKILNKKGYKIARRTVSKYREEINIPNSILRKKIKGLQK